MSKLALALVTLALVLLDAGFGCSSPPPREDATQPDGSP